MSQSLAALVQLLRDDRRYRPEAYQFVRDSLEYAHREMGLGCGEPISPKSEPPPNAHLTGQELCEAIRRHAIDQYGLMAKLVLNSWGLHCTSDFGEIVYNLIRINMMKKSNTDRREDFNDVYDFDEAFVKDFEFTAAE